MASAARTSAVVMTAEEFLLYPVPDAKAELVRGELRVSPPAGGPHSVAVGNICKKLFAFFERVPIGRVFVDGTGFELVSLRHTVRVPDASVVRNERLPAAGIGPGLLKLAPDLVIEVLSPSETASDLQEKLDDYAAAGTPLVWVVDPMRWTVSVVAAGEQTRRLREGDALDGGMVIPGFSCAVSEIFEGIARDL